VALSERLLKKITHNSRQMALILVGVAAFLVAKLVNDIEFPNIVPEIDEFHMYSGIHPQLYKEYLQYKSEGRRIDAQNALEELALYADFDFREEIQEKILKRQESLFI
jgi:hypothetical protein